MSKSPIMQTMDEMFGRLSAAILTRAEAERQITEYTNALRALAKVIEDKEAGDSYLASLDELCGKPGFVESIRAVVRSKPEGLTPTEIKSYINLRKSMDLSAYSNPMASIHTTIRRMVDSGELESFTNKKGEKAYRPALKPVGVGRMTPPPEAPRTLRRRI